MRVKVLICGICILFLQNIFAQQKIIDSLKKSIQTHAQKDTTRIKSLIEIGKYIVNTEKDKVIEYAHEALEIAEQLDNIALKIQAYINLAKIYNLQNKNINAINYYQKVASLCEQANDTTNLAGVYFGLATIYRSQEWYKKAEQYNQKALSIISEHPKYKTLKAKIYNNIGILYNQQKDYVKSIEYFIKSLKIKEEIKDTLGMPTTLCNLAIGYYYKSDLKDEKKSHEYLQKAKNIAKKINNYYMIGYTIVHLAKIELENKNHNKALEYTKEVLNNPLYRQYQDVYSYALFVMSQIYYATQQYHKCLEYGFLALKNIQNKADSIENQIQIYSLLSDVYQKQEKYKEALIYKQKENALRDSSFAKYKREQKALSENDYELLRIEQKNEKLKSLNQLQNERLRKQGITIAFVIVAFTLASILTILLIYANSSRNHYFKELKKRNQVISEINAELQKNNQIKDKLFSIISHDLRSPLATTKGLLLLLKDEPNLPEEFKIYFNQASKSIDATFMLLDNLLKWSAAQMQSIKVRPFAFSVQALIQEIQEIYASVAQEKKIELLTNIPQDYKVFADRDMLHLVFRNLINNAIKFTPEQGKIQISVQKQDKEVLVYIKDTGVGIPKEHLEKIFEGFSTRGTASEKGIGLGLQLCKEFITLNNGKLNVESEPNEGSTFSFNIPLAEI